MKIRQAKKILNGKVSKKKLKHYNKLRPLYKENDMIISPSWDDIDIFRRANLRIKKYFK